MKNSKSIFIKTVDANLLTPHPDNPQIHSKAQVNQIAKSIETFGFKFPVLIDDSNQIIAGHGRVMAAKELGITKIPTIIADDLSKAQIRALMLADNKLTENASWDNDLLAKNFQILDELDLNFDLDITGFDYGDIESLLLIDEKGELNPADELPDLEENIIVSRIGDIWQLGKHRILCGSSLDKSSYELLFEGKQADLVFADPPYNLPAKAIGKVCEKQHGNFINAAGEMSSDEFREFLSTSFKYCKDYSAKGSIHYFCMDWRHIGEILAAGNKHYTEFKNLCVWTKDNAGMGSFYRSQHELVFVFKNGKGKHQNNFKLGQHGRYRSNVWQYPSVRSFKSENGDVASEDALDTHPTIKPVSLIEDVLLDCSKRGEIILDNFLGSGSTLIACEKQKRICYGIEIDPKYVDASLKRWQEWTGNDAICLSRDKKNFNQLLEELL